MIDFLQPKDGPIAPGQEHREVIYAKDQPEYIPLRTLRGDAIGCPVVSRWSPTAEQRKALAEGKDIFLELLTFRQPLQPIIMYLGDDDSAEEVNLRTKLREGSDSLMVTGGKDHLSADAMKAGKCGFYEALDKHVRDGVIAAAVDIGRHHQELMRHDESRTDEKLRLMIAEAEAEADRNDGREPGTLETRNLPRGFRC